MSAPESAAAIQRAKDHLAMNLQTLVLDTSHLVNRVAKSSGSSAMLSKAAKQFAAKEGTLAHTKMNLERLAVSVDKMHSQTDDMIKTVQKLPEIQRALDTMTATK